MYQSLYEGPLLCGFNVAIKGLRTKRDHPFISYRTMDAGDLLGSKFIRVQLVSTADRDSSSKVPMHCGRMNCWRSCVTCESSPGSFDECRTAPSGRQPKTKPEDLGCESACTGCQSLHPPSPFIIITQPKSWYYDSNYCCDKNYATQRRLAQHSVCVTERTLKFIDVINVCKRLLLLEKTRL